MHSRGLGCASKVLEKRTVMSQKEESTVASLRSRLDILPAFGIHDGPDDCNGWRATDKNLQSTLIKLIKDVRRLPNGRPKNG